MLRKVLFSFLIASLLSVLLIWGVWAQAGTPQAQPAGPRIEPTAAVVTQTVPLTLTVYLPGPTGTQTLTLPVFLNLDIRIGLSSEMTASVVTTTSLTVPEPTTAVTLTPTTVPATATPLLTPTTVPATPLPPTPTPPATPTPVAAALTSTPAPVTESETTTTTVESGPPLCPDPRAVITSPTVGQVLTGTVTIMGTATHENFQYYKLEYAPGAGATEGFAYLAGAETQVTDGVLAEVDTTELDNGVYTIQLVVVDRSGNFPPPCAVTVEIAN